MSITSRPPMAQNQIPKVRELQDQLGFDATDGRSPADLRDATHHFRREYLTSDGTPGRELKNWKTSRTQTELLRMARTFLEDEHYGMKFWPASANLSSKRGLEYPKDSDKLAELLQQLFWRQNIYSAHNANNPDRGRQVRESVESDRSSVTVQPNKSYSVERPRFFNLSDQDLQRLPSRVGTNDTRSAGISEDAPNSSGLPSPRYETTGAVEHRKSTLSTTHARWGLLKNSEHLVPAAVVGQPPNSSATLESSDDSDLPEDIFAYLENRKQLVHQESGPNEESIEATANQDEVVGIMQIEGPRTRGVAPEAKMLAGQQKPSTPDHGVTIATAPTSKTKSSTESKRTKRKGAEDDDPEYTPSKKLKGKRHFSNIASSKPRRCRPGKAHDNGVQLQSGSATERLTSPSTPISTTITGTDRVLSSRSAGSSELGQPSTPENQKIPIEKSPSMPRRTPLLDKLKERRKQEKLRSDSMNEVDRGHRQTVLNFSPVFKAGETSAQSEGSPSMGLYDTRPRDAADEMQPPPESNLDTAIQAAADEPDDALDTGANILEHDSVRSRTSLDTGLATPEPAQDDPPLQITDNVIEIRYSIIASRIPRLVKRHWPVRSLSGKTVRTLFEEVSKFTSKPDIQRIVFKLNLSQADSEYTIQEDDHRTFEAMKDEFADDIMADWKENGTTKFSIWLEPDPAEEGNQMAPGASGVLNVDEGRPRITI